MELKSPTDDDTRPRVTSNESKLTEVAFIIPFCCLGALARMGLDIGVGSIESIAGFPIYKSFFSNLLGCFLIGCFSSLPKSNFKTGLTTGLCGCLTTYSGWNDQQAIALVFLNFKSGHEKGISVLTWPIAICCFVGFLLIGKDMKIIWSKIPEKIKNIHVLFPTGVSVLLLVAGLGLIFLNSVNRIIWLAMLFAPLGGLSRHLLGTVFNGWKKYPLGTYLANVIGSCILSALTVTRISLSSTNETDNIGFDPIQIVTQPPDPEIVSDFILMAVGSGFCSSLTTISSFINDIVNLPPKRRYIYAFITVISTQALSCVIYLIAFSIIG